jgi:hypothetical protein
MPVAAAVPAIAGIGSSIFGGITGSNAAKAAAQAQQNQLQNSINYTNNARDTGTAAQSNVWLGDQQNLQPYQQAGTQALSQLGGAVLSGTPSASAVLAQDPGYAFRLQQGELAQSRANAAAGGLGSGGALKAAQQYGQDYASGEYGQAFNRYLQGNQQRYNQLLGMAGLGQNANQLYATSGANYANQIGNLGMDAAKLNQQAYAGIGDAQASGYIGSANALSGMVSGIAKNLPGLTSLFPQSPVSSATTKGINAGFGNILAQGGNAISDMGAQNLPLSQMNPQDLLDVS